MVIYDHTFFKNNMMKFRALILATNRLVFSLPVAILLAKKEK